VSAKQKCLIYCDGCAKNNNAENPGPAGWAAVIQHDNAAPFERFGSCGKATNQFAELIAFIRAVEETAIGAEVKVFTDSRYVVDGVNSWIKSWRKNGWKNTKGKPIANFDLWSRINVLIQDRKVTAHWVKGHNGHPLNERADELANLGATGRTHLG